VSRKRSITFLTLWLCAAARLCSRAAAVELHEDLSILGQVRQDDQSRQTQSPMDLYGDLGVAGLHHGTSLDTYFRLEHDFGTGQGPTEFYDGAIRVPGAIPGVDVTLGRQFLNEGPGGVFIADAGKIRIDPGGPVAFTVFGGQPRYFEPTFSSESLSQDEQIFGGSIRTTHLKNGYLSLGYFQQDRDQPVPNQPDQRVLRQLVSAAGSQAFPTLPGLPSFYGSAALDAKRQNIDQATAGFDGFLAQPRLSFNFESTYYKPQDQGERLQADINRREDPIFELFSLSQMLQFRGGLHYMLSRTLSAFGDYSYQRYEQLDNSFINGHLGNVGVLWLPGGDGLEVVRLEYYVIDGGSGNVNGGRFYYESRVYDRILFRTKADVAYYEKATNERDTAVTSLLGLGYAFTRDLIAELDFEANHNKRFNEDFRFGFAITYKLRQRTGSPESSHAAPTKEAS
jgi:hypothetical protein